MFLNSFLTYSISYRTQTIDLLSCRFIWFAMVSTWQGPPLWKSLEHHQLYQRKFLQQTSSLTLYKTLLLFLGNGDIDIQKLSVSYITWCVFWNYGFTGNLFAPNTSLIYTSIFTLFIRSMYCSMVIHINGPTYPHFKSANHWCSNYSSSTHFLFVRLFVFLICCGFLYFNFWYNKKKNISLWIILLPLK